MKTVYDDNRIRKDKRRGKVAGVCAGLARYFDTPAWLIRLAAILCFITFPMAVAIAYIVAAFILPDAY
jgi:phage shock protein C